MNQKPNRIFEGPFDKIILKCFQYNKHAKTPVKLLIFQGNGGIIISDIKTYNGYSSKARRYHCINKKKLIRLQNTQEYATQAALPTSRSIKII